MTIYWRRQQRPRSQLLPQKSAPPRYHQSSLTTERQRTKVDAQSKQVKSTGFTPNILAESVAESAQEKSILTQNGASPVLSSVPTVAASSTSTAEVSASQLLAILVMIGDFRALRAVCPDARMGAKDGKIYWSASISGHVLDLFRGKLSVDGRVADDSLYADLLDGGE